MEPIYKDKFYITVRMCDAGGRLRPSSILQMFQDYSEILTEKLSMGPKEMESKKLIWVVTRVSCECFQLPKCEDEVAFTVWASKSRLCMFPWQYVLQDKDGNILIKGCSVWVLADAETRSILSPRIPKIDIELKNPEFEPYPRPRPLQIPERLTQSEFREVRYSEVDINGHMNNTSYLNWVTDLNGPVWMSEHIITSLDLEFRNEIMPGETIELKWDIWDNTLYCDGSGRFRCIMKYL